MLNCKFHRVSSFLILSLISIAFGSFSQTGSISGRISDKKTNELLIGVNVVIQGTTIGSATDLNGDFKIPAVKPGSYNIVLSYISYKTKVIQKVKVEAGSDTKLSEALEEDMIVVNDVVITGRKISNTDVALLNKIKSSDMVISGVSAQIIAKTLDKDASEVIKRVPGVTIIDGRFVMVRGLSERYNTVWLNGATTPSSESDVKAFSFDVIPGSLIDNLLIYKTAAPDLPSDFAGASIQILTKNVPDNNAVYVSYGTAYRQGTTSKEFYSNQGGKYDWLGFDDGTRALGNDFPPPNEFIELTNSSLEADRNKVTNLGRSLNKNWTSHQNTAIPDQKFSFGLTRRYNIKKITLGNIASLNYSNTKHSYSSLRADFQSYDTINDKSVYYYDYHDNQYTTAVKISALYNWSVAWGNNNKIDFRNLFNQISNNKTTIRNGKEYYGGNTIKAYEFKFQSRSVYSGQLGGTHSFNGEKTKLTWTTGYAYTNRKEPDIKRLSFSKVEEDPSDPHYGDYALQFFFAASPEKVGMVYLDMKENILMASANLNHKISINKFKPELKFGFFYENKNREYNARNLGFKMANPAYFNPEIPFMDIEDIFADENINDSTGIKLDEKTNASDSYKATNELLAGYVGLKFQPIRKTNLYLGLRLEHNQQTLSSFKTDNCQHSCIC